MTTIIQAMTDEGLLGAAFSEDSWRPWQSFLAALFGLGIDDPVLDLCRRCTGRADWLAHDAYREAWIVAGRRSGKSRVLALIACYLAAFVKWRPRLAAGEVGVVMLLAADRDQAGVLLAYCRALLLDNPMLRQLVTNENAQSIELAKLKVSIEVHVSSYRSVRGRTVIAALCDEVAFWRSELSANPAEETVRALRPALMTLAPHSMLIGASSPYSRQGLLWQQYRKHHGREGSRVLVWQAPSIEMNPSLDRQEIDRALEEDPQAGTGEWLAEFRSDIARFVDQAVIEAAVVPGRLELPRVAAVRYHGFIDPSGGSSDSFTMAIAHREGDRAVLDCIREVKPPFSPETVVEQYAAVLRDYGITRATSDRYAGIWPVEAFARRQIVIEQAAEPKSTIYGGVLPGLNSGRVELLDHVRLQAQLGGLERRTSRSGRDSIAEPPGGHDDVCNAACGALAAALARPQASKVDYRSQSIVGVSSAGELWRRPGQCVPPRMS